MCPRSVFLERENYMRESEIRNLTLDDQQRFLTIFWERCLYITATKGSDYAPDRIPLLEMCSACAEVDISIPQGLWVLYRKHFSAIRKHFFLNKELESELISGRLLDAANYFAFLAFYDGHKHELRAAWSRHWTARMCTCYELDESTPKDKCGELLCERCTTLSWLARQV